MRLCMLLLACFQQANIFEPTGIYQEKPRDIVAVQPVQAPIVSRRYLVMFTASSCGPCRQWKSTVLPQLEREGYTVVLADMDDAGNVAAYGSIAPRYPAFRAADWNSRRWVTDTKFGGIDLTTAKWMLDGSSLTSPKQPVQREVVLTEERVLSPRVAVPSRFIQWPGWGQIDLETYNRNCNCGMCQSIRSQQQEYRRQLQLFQQPQTQVTPDQEGTPDALVTDLLDKMQLRTGDVLAELGCGDGRILIAAAKRGIRGIGVELDPVRAQVARENVRRHGLTELITVETGDALEFDFSRANCATTYLYPPLLAKLSAKLKSLRVVGSPYHEVPGLPMTQFGDVWIYRNGDTDEGILENNTVGSLRGSRAVAGSGTDIAR